MTKRFFLITLFFISLFSTSIVYAIPIGPDNDNPSLPKRVVLEGMQQVWQQFNRCSAAALTMQISYWRGEMNYYDTIRNLNPRDEDASTRLDEMVAYAQTFGLAGVERLGGDLPMLKRLVSAGFPVLVETVYYEEGEDAAKTWMSHNRVMVGYDDDKGEAYFYDSLLGFGADNIGKAVKYDELMERWRQLNYSYMVLYEPNQEAQVQSLMGEVQWDKAQNIVALYDRINNIDLIAKPNDAFNHFNLGTALARLGRYEEAVVAYDKAREIGLPFRMMWYQFDIFETYLQVNRPQDVQTLAWRVIGDAPGVEEMYYYLALAYIATDDMPRAISNLEQAIWYNRNFTQAAELLAQLQNS
ncbi:MAG: C39 family peptidase [Anaerolineae bacterium]|nr:C39 family peptidase [Anaerolineae bacterium]